MEIFGNIQYEKIKQLKDERDVLKKTLKRKQDNMKAVQKLRKEKKVVGERLTSRHVAHVVGEEDLLVEDIDDELDMLELRPLISIPQRGGVEKIVNLAEWMKSPWALKSD